MEDQARLARYEQMHQALKAEYQEVCARLEALGAQGKTKTVTFQTCFARKISLQEWLDVYERYGL